MEFYFKIVFQVLQKNLQKDTLYNFYIFLTPEIKRLQKLTEKRRNKL